ncbi:TPA: hypothetical protein UZ441_004605 [Escherichia coli]|uniref:hypothetical protein n=1 Tax=Escherichia coli TaxID=562 RepID=UPI001F0E8156|nr:hypothetical protein [Escherichia coli]UMR98819.1 hypothetical protein AOY87_11430 [Escherichia coli]HEL8025848.1 hypothetical protein [Escherichia coli]HEL8044526.1 hypothetical protein [Escherichia coli]HEL8049472.1 hypothetical protein [Escherichia coli]HEL8054238.1 hypothetical protein [Escherichia coli]
MDVHKIQLAKVYSGDRFISFGIAVNGKLLDGQHEAKIEYGTTEAPRITVVFSLTREAIENGPVIGLDQIL